MHGTFSDAPVPLLAGFLKALAVCERVFAERERAARENESLTPDPTPPEDAHAEDEWRSEGGVRPGGCRRLLLIDNVAAFYWLDRASRAEHGALEPARGAPRVRGAADGDQPTVQGADHRDQGDDVVGVVGEGGDRARQPGQIRRGIQPGCNGAESSRRNARGSTGTSFRSSGRAR